MATTTDVSLVDHFVAAFRGERLDIHTALPGIVTAYDPTTQLADVKPAIKVPQFNADGSRGAARSLPVLPKVPVLWPRSSGFMHVLPLAKGDFVWVMFSEGGTGEFRLSGQESEPFDVSRHQITYPVCMPGCLPDKNALADASVHANDRAVWGQSGGPQIQNDGNHITFSPSGTTADPGDAPALASVVDKIIAAFNAWTVAPNDGGAALFTKLSSQGIINPSSPPTSKSALIKCK